MWALSHSDWPSTGHSDLSIDKQPYTKRSHLHSVNWSPFGLALVVFHPLGHAQPTTTLHTLSIPPQGVNSLSFAWKEKVPGLYNSCNKPLKIYFPYPNVPISAVLTFCFPSWLLSPIYQTTQQLLQSISPQMLSLGMLWPCTTLQQTSHDVTGSISQVMYSTTYKDDWRSQAK